VRGFFQPETSTGVNFRWSGPESRLLLHGAGARPMVLALRMFHPPQAAAEGQQYGLQLAHDEQVFAAFALSGADTWRTYHVLLPPHAVVGADSSALPLELRSASYTPGSDDGRRLGVPLDWLRIIPLPGELSVGVVLLRALALLWALGLLAGGLWWLQVALLPRAWWPARLLLFYLPVAAATLALLGWAAVNPYTLAWALPPMPWILGLLSVLLAALWWGRGTLEHSMSAHVSLPDMVQRAPWVVLLLVFLLALALRFYQIDSLPYGLWRDEARHGLIALRMLEEPDYRPIYVASGGVNMPALGFYPFAMALKLWGVHPWTMRIVTALAGALTIFPLYALVSHLFGRRDVALLAAALLAVSSWHISMSRFSFPTVFDPLLSLTGLWLLAWAGSSLQQQQRPGEWRSLLLALLAGGCFGLAAHVYHTGRLALLVAGLFGLLLLWQQRQQWRRWLLLVVTCAVGYVLVVSPLVGYVLRHPDSFNERVGHVFLLGPNVLEGRAPLHVLDSSVGRHLLMFNIQGDSNGRHHAPHAPLLDVITGVGFLAGCGLLLSRWRDWRSLLLLAALAIGILPSLLAVEGPHAMRSIGALAYAYIIAALGWVWLAGLLRCVLPAVVRPASAALLPLLLVVALALNVYTYFGSMATNPVVWTSFYPVHTQVGAYLRNTADAYNTTVLDQVYVAQDLTDNSVFGYLTHGVAMQTFSEASASRSPQPGALFVLSGYTYLQDVQLLRAEFGPLSGPVATGPAFPGVDDPSFVVYRLPE
jgi:4-amino-4-deoxy-L-arabinose transferase-like glycosyltransferase